MQFDLLDKPLVYIPVKWSGVREGPNGEAVATEHSVEVQVEILDRVELVAWIGESAVDTSDGVDEAAVAHILAKELGSFKRVAQGWRGVKAGNKTAPFTDENIERIIRAPGFTDAFGEAYMAAWRGQVATREGNSGGSAEHGQAAEPSDATRKDETKPTPPAN